MRLVSSDSNLPFQTSDAYNYCVYFRGGAVVAVNTRKFRIIVCGRASLKRPHEGSYIDDDGSGSVSDDAHQLKRTRRSSRPNVRQRVGPTLPKTQVAKSRGIAPKIGAEYQAEVPSAPLPENERTADKARCESELVFSVQRCKGDSNVSEFLKQLDVEVCKRDGFPLSPIGCEIALTCLASTGGSMSEGIKLALQRVQGASHFPGTGAAWTYDEKCLFVRAMAESSKDFQFISRNVLKNRSTKELVFMYYTHHKQQRLQNGGRKGGLIFDTGKEMTRFLRHLGPERSYLALRSLAVTAGDGFPADRRMAEVVREHRREKVLLSRRETRSGSRKGPLPDSDSNGDRDA